MAQLFNSRVQPFVKIYESVGRPQLSPKFLTRDYFAWPFQQHRQNLKRLILNVDQNTAAIELASCQVGLEESKAKAASIGGDLHYALRKLAGVYHKRTI